MATLEDLFSIGVKQVITGYVEASASAGSGEDVVYVDVTISAVNTAKSVVFFLGGTGSSAVNARLLTASSASSSSCTARLTSTTNVRISANTNLGTPIISGRYTVLEFY
jgi:hypothetical protein